MLQPGRLVLRLLNKKLRIISIWPGQYDVAWNIEQMQNNKMNKNIDKPSTDLRCPDCGGKVIYYHSSYKAGDGRTRVVCAHKCCGWKIIKDYDL